ncbi:uncharacterized protein LOC134267044 [Saccostrea cucullata]|uniref:uncharacterized protein LOC134238143 n=1 Tax=Saccostrea cuccullata TaxID=36930 RepID=UPI002ED38C91
MKPNNQNTGVQTRAQSEQEASGGQDEAPPRTTTSRSSTTTTTTNSTERPAGFISLPLPTISTVRTTPNITTTNPPRVTVHLTPYDRASSAVQWWLNFMSYVSVYQMTDSQALNIIPFNITEPVKHWFYQLAQASKSSLSAFKHAFFDRYRKTDEDLDLDDIKQGANEKLDSYLFRLQ